MRANEALGRRPPAGGGSVVRMRDGVVVRGQHQRAVPKPEPCAEAGVAGVDETGEIHVVVILAPDGRSILREQEAPKRVCGTDLESLEGRAAITRRAIAVAASTLAANPFDAVLGLRRIEGNPERIVVPDDRNSLTAAICAMIR